MVADAPSNVEQASRRVMNHDSYKLPSDAPELTHKMLTLSIEGLYPAEAAGLVDAAFVKAKNEKRAPKVLDIGSGSGVWAAEFAEKLHEAEVLGFDLEKSNPPNKPKNCRFEKANAVDKLNQHVGEFDFIQCRMVSKHVPNAEELVRNIGKALRPGGVFVFCDTLKYVYKENLDLFPEADKNKTDYDDNLDRSWVAFWLAEVNRQFPSKAEGNTDGDKLVNLIRDDGHFENIHQVIHNFPIGCNGGKHVASKNRDEISRLMRLNYSYFVPSSKPSLLKSGAAPELVDAWERNTMRELDDLKKKTFLKWAWSWGTKKA